jgi:hypothetical protein
MPSRVATAIWAIASGNGDAPDRQQILQREVQTDAEHEQNDADLRQLRRQALVGHVARRERAHRHAGQKVADQRRDPQPLGEDAEHEGKAEGGNDGRDQGRLMLHAPRPS